MKTWYKFWSFLFTMESWISCIRFRWTFTSSLEKKTTAREIRNQNNNNNNNNKNPSPGAQHPYCCQTCHSRICWMPSIYKPAPTQKRRRGRKGRGRREEKEIEGERKGREEKRRGEGRERGHLHGNSHFRSDSKCQYPMEREIISLVIKG